LKRAKEQIVSDKQIEEKEAAEEKEIAKKGEIMALTNPEDEIDEETSERKSDEE